MNGKQMATPINNGFCRTKSGDEFLAVELEVIEGEHKGERVTIDVWTSDAEAFKATVTKYLGWEGYAGTNADGKAILEGLKGPVAIYAYEKDVNGTMRQKASFTPPSGIYDKGRISLGEARQTLKSIGAKMRGGNGAKPPPANMGDAYEGPDAGDL